ncbi:uncharacterized protein BJX67DRAFT_302018 [Aspergillus lucknowensis]|uniref:Uncharacterized protein n=1 Tax=Aspergillus lucknowensis TaxID=176173 RepID=A0ABR4LZP5_9EURO
MVIRPPIGRWFPPRRRDNRTPDEQQPENQQAENQFYPGLFDVLRVRHILLWKVKPEGFPAEVVDMIVDAAEYWPSTEFAMGERRRIRKDVDEALVYTTPLCYDENTLESGSPKVLPHRTAHPCRKIVFSIVSHDQGGLHERLRLDPNRAGIYEGSFTWFDAEVIRKAHEPPQRDAVRQKMHPTEKRPQHFGPNHPLLLPRSNALQRNRTRTQEAKRHTIVWHHLDHIPANSPEAEEMEQSQGRGRDTVDGKQVRELEPGDSILVWGRARFPGWVNYVDELSVRVFWAV